MKFFWWLLFGTAGVLITAVIAFSMLMKSEQQQFADMLNGEAYAAAADGALLQHAKAAADPKVISRDSARRGERTCSGSPAA